MTDVVIRDATTADAGPCSAIYAPAVRDTAISFEFDVPDATEFAARIRRVQQTDPWLVATIDDVVVGYAYSTDFRARAAYAHTRETTVYVHDDHHGAGIGSALMRRLIEDLAARGAHSAVACIALPNDASVTLHERLGFTRVGVFHEAGRKFDRWHDVGFWELLLDG